MMGDHHAVISSSSGGNSNERATVATGLFSSSYSSSSSSSLFPSQQQQQCCSDIGDPLRQPLLDDKVDTTCSTAVNNNMKNNNHEYDNDDDENPTRKIARTPIINSSSTKDERGQQGRTARRKQRTTTTTTSASAGGGDDDDDDNNKNNGDDDEKKKNKKKKESQKQRGRRLRERRTGSGRFYMLLTSSQEEQEENDDDDIGDVEQEHDHNHDIEHSSTPALGDDDDDVGDHGDGLFRILRSIASSTNAGGQNHNDEEEQNAFDNEYEAFGLWLHDIMWKRTLFPDETIELVWEEQESADSSCGDDNDNDDPTNSSSSSSKKNKRITIMDGYVVKLLKFITFTFLGIAFMYWFVRFMNWEHDEALELSDILVYEGNLITQDIIVFFVVSRMWKIKINNNNNNTNNNRTKRTLTSTSTTTTSSSCGIDCIGFVLFTLLANIYASYITTFSFLQHSFTLYEMHCTWPSGLWVFIGILTPLIIIVVLLHIRYIIHTGKLIQKIFELTISFLLFVAPLLTSPYFHLHHWYAGWLFGMHCNGVHKWWSYSVMAWCWGLYMNGIAVYGRDPVLTCDYALFISEDQSCPYIKCNIDGLKTLELSNNETDVTPMVPLDWRNCTA